LVHLYKPLSKQQCNGRLDVGSFQEYAIESACFSQALYEVALPHPTVSLIEEPTILIKHGALAYFISLSTNDPIYG
jgi:hypothetical protein